MSRISTLLTKLNEEYAGKEKVESFIEELMFFSNNRDDIGLEEKLRLVGRLNEASLAKEKKQEFDKLKLKFEHFPSAQKIFAIMLSVIHEVFESHISKQNDQLTKTQAENIIDEKIIKPLMADIESCEDNEHVLITQTHLKGMIYWLADSCWVRWD